LLDVKMCVRLQIALRLLDILGNPAL